jgi:hypothetical protein
MDLGEFLWQRRERAQAERLEELWRENSAIPLVTGPKPVRYHGDEGSRALTT